MVGGPVFVTDYPLAIKAFYMRLNDDERTVAAMDLLVPRVGEIIGGSQREERYDVLSRKDAGGGDRAGEPVVVPRYSPLGKLPSCRVRSRLRALLMYVTGMENIRDVIPFPRTPGNARF